MIDSATFECFWPGALGVGNDDVIATLCWNSPAHLAAYFAVPSMGAVLHTLNLRLHDDQLVYVANHASDKVILVDADLVPQLQRIIGRLDTVETVIIAGSAELDAPDRIQVHRLDALLAAHEPKFAWPPLDEHSAAALCYTTGTTGAPARRVVVLVRSGRFWRRHRLSPADRGVGLTPSGNTNTQSESTPDNDSDDHRHCGASRVHAG